MLCPTAVSAVAAAGWLLASLGLGLSLPAEDNSESGFALCSHCFYRQMPPRRAPAEPLLHPVCHTLPGGQVFASFYKPTCNTAVYSAFHLSNGWTEREEEEFVSKEGDGVKVIVPTLLRGDEGPSHLVSSADSTLQRWDSTVTTLVQSSIAPRCGTFGGALYILIGAGGLGATRNGDELLWSAVCCDVPEGKGSFSVSLIRETGEEEKQVSLRELEEMLGVAELFSEGCGGAGGEAVGAMVGLHDEVDPGEVEKLESGGEDTGSKGTDSDTTHQDTRGNEVNSDQDSDKESRENTIAREQTASLEAQLEEDHAADVAQQTSAETVMSESSEEKQDHVTEAVKLEPAVSSDDNETLEKDTNSRSILVYILTTTLSILKAPLRPLFSTITQLPQQMTYVLQEDLGILSALPGDTLSLLHLLTSDLLSGLGSATDMLLDVGESCFTRVYYCTSCMLGALLNSCHTGVTGIGTLAGDTVGIFGDALDNAWWVTKLFGGQLWEQSEGYVGSVMSEMGGQVKAVGGGLGRLLWRGGNGVGSVFRLGGGLIMGVMDMIIGVVRDPYREDSE
ncbi:hypothetical protein LDENG_00049720 [Lucifuga dentata]|nr:hypothetical protein LDENG_00049720 [Lucifuga dentata]